MEVKKETYISAELSWAETQLKSWRAYVDKNSFEDLKDRIEWKPTARGGVMPMVIASIEAQGKFLQETMKNYLALLDVVNDLREKQHNRKIEVRGKAELGYQAETFLRKRG